ncbi:MAG: F420-0:Gamma-glutamyl ligase [Hormoscilla sp. GM7CHS1pb]|nr:F420-0:Gamma-glutamyl ligase [Hormoscilla sp. GM7CHS1pb]
MNVEIIIVGVAALLIALGLELQYRRRPGNNLELTAGNWKLDINSPQHYQLTGTLEFINRTKTLEIMLPEVRAEVKLLSASSLEGVSCNSKVISMHSDAPPREDGYWDAYIVKIGKKTRIQVNVEITGDNLSGLETAWIKIHYITYGPEGRINKVRHIIHPLQYPDSSIAPKKIKVKDAEVLPIRTHLLTELDNPVEVVKRYVLPHAKTGDIVTIGETPVALMQGRYRHPSTVKPGWAAKRICYYFMPTSSLATACGMQTLVDIVGPVRVVLAFALGAIAKAVLRKPGVFYQLAGEQARLIDDVTGTLPPYEQFIVLGPENPQQVVAQIKQETGLSAAIVDVNDLKAVKILAATPGTDRSLLEQALIGNPAGNADEQTPVVLIAANS